MEPVATAGNDREHRLRYVDDPHFVLELGHMFLDRGLLREGPRQHELCLEDTSKRDFTVPLTRAAICSLLARGVGDFVFAMKDGARPIGGLTRVKAALGAAIETNRAGPLTPWVFHDLRRALATWLSDRSVDYVITDLCLAHSIPLDRSRRTYQRSYRINERRQALDLLSTLVDPEPARKGGRALPLRVVA
jgi:integrase